MIEYQEGRTWLQYFRQGTLLLCNIIIGDIDLKTGWVRDEDGVLYETAVRIPGPAAFRHAQEHVDNLREANSQLRSYETLRYREEEHLGELWRQWRDACTG